MKPSNEPLRRVSSRNSKHLSIIKNPRDRYTPPFPDKILLRGSLEETRQWIYIYLDISDCSYESKLVGRRNDVTC